MARTIANIYAAMVAEKQNQPTINSLQPNVDTEQHLLADITTPSKVANWRLYFYVIAIAIFILENLWDLFKADVDAIVASAIPGTARWYQEQALEFQFGDALVWLNNKFQYAVINVANQIIKRSAAIESGGVVYIKVAKLNGTSPVKLAPAELTAFQAYMQAIKFAGTQIGIISYDPDLLKLTLNVVYDPLVLASDGSLLSNAGVFPVEDAINDYIAGIVWNGTFNATKLIDAIEAAQGVIDPVLTLAEGKANNASVFNTINQNYQSVAGYMIIDPANALNTTITYTANV